MADQLVVGNFFFFPHESCTKRIAASSSLAGFHREPNYRSRRSERPSLVANGVGTSDVNDNDFDPWMAWAYRPRTISLLLIGACLLMGVWAMIAVCLAYSLLQAPFMILIKLHPALGA